MFSVIMVSKYNRLVHSTSSLSYLLKSYPFCRIQLTPYLYQEIVPDPAWRILLPPLWLLVEGFMPLL